MEIIFGGRVSSTVALGLTIIICHWGIKTTAQNSPQDYLAAHNAARAQVGVGAMQWDENVAAFARWWAAQLAGNCVMQHSDSQLRSSRGLGENLFMGGGNSWTAADAVKLWVDERANYDYNSNSCTRGQCGHYTQVVWRGSTRLGCARVSCRNGNGVIIACNYNPEGNWIGQRPF